MSKQEKEQSTWMKIDLHIHTLDDPKDVIDYSAHELLEKAKSLGFGVLAITLHDAVFNRPEVFAEAEAVGILLLSAAEMRLEGADVILLNVRPDEVAGLKTFADLRALRKARGPSLFTIAPHPLYVLGGSIGKRRLTAEIDCFDAIEICHFHKGLFNPNRAAARLARKFGKPLIATSDAHRLHAFGNHYTSMARPPELNVSTVFQALRTGPLHLTSPPASIADFFGAIYWVFICHPFQVKHRAENGGASCHMHEVPSARPQAAKLFR